MSSPSPSPQIAGRSMTIAGAVAAGIGLVGFLVGIAEPVNATRASRQTGNSLTGSAPVAPNYRAIDSTVSGPNRGWSSHWTSLRQDRPGLFDPVVRTPSMKDAALQDRLRTRAFDGAPPVIPHPVEQQSATNCLACHENGLLFGTQIATKISHPHYANCLQCHVEQSFGVPAADIAATTETPNEFAGVIRSGPGARAMPGAPPTIPHTLQLRDDCLSCHGLVARPGLRTTHPWLQNCRQCHAADESAERPRFAEAFPAVVRTP